MFDQISSTVENGQKTALNQSICVYIILKQEFVHPKFFALGVDSSKLPSQLRQLLEVGLARQAAEAVSRLIRGCFSKALSFPRLYTNDCCETTAIVEANAPFYCCLNVSRQFFMRSVWDDS